MAWTTSMVSQNGNSTVSWSISGSALSTHDCVVLKHVSGNSGITIKSITVYRAPTRYTVTVQVIGSGAVSYRFAAEQMD